MDEYKHFGAKLLTFIIQNGTGFFKLQNFFLISVKVAECNSFMSIFLCDSESFIVCPDLCISVLLPSIQIVKENQE
jgi:hypothetical protein